MNVFLCFLFFLKTSKTHWFFNEIGWCRGSRREGLALLFALFGLLLGSLGHLLGNPVLRRKSKAEIGVLFKNVVRLGGRFWTPKFPKMRRTRHLHIDPDKFRVPACPQDPPRTLPRPPQDQILTKNRSNIDQKSIKNQQKIDLGGFCVACASGV